MNHELAKTLTTALVQFIDRERPEGTMDCSNGECVSLEKAFTEENFDSVETLIKKKLSRLTEFELALRNAMSDTVVLSEDKEDYVISEIADKQAKRYSAELLALAKEELCRGCNANIEGYTKGREDAEKRYNEGYNKGYKDAEKRYNESVAYHYQEPVPPGVAYKSPQCYTDVMITPNTNSGTSTLKAEG